MATSVPYSDQHIMENIFKDKGLISLIPFFAAIYLSSVDRQLLPASIIIALSTVAYYLIVNCFAKQAIQKNRTSETSTYEDLVSKRNQALAGWAAGMHLLMSIITLLLLYPHLKEFNAYTLFWLIVTATIFNLFYRIIFSWDIIKKKFKGQYSID